MSLSLPAIERVQDIDESKNDNKSSKLSPTNSYACITLVNSKPFITNSWTHAGYSSVVIVVSLFLLASADSLRGKDAKAAADAAYWLDNGIVASVALVVLFV